MTTKEMRAIISDSYPGERDGNGVVLLCQEIKYAQYIIHYFQEIEISKRKKIVRSR